MKRILFLCGVGFICLSSISFAKKEEPNPLEGKSFAELRKIIKESPDAEFRYDALRAIAKKGEEATQLLIETLNDKCSGVGYGAAQSLGERGEASLDLALGLLKHEDKQQRALGTIMLKHIGKKASPAVTVPALVKCLKDVHFDVRMNAADALAVLGDKAEPAVPALLEAARDKEWWVRQQVYYALAAIDTPEVRSALIDIQTAELHSCLGGGGGGPWMQKVFVDPALQQKLARAYGQWLLKEEGYINTFAARNKMWDGIGRLEYLVKAKAPIPSEVAKVIRLILADKAKTWETLKTAVWTVDEKTQKRLKAILVYMDADKGVK